VLRSRVLAGLAVLAVAGVAALSATAASARISLTVTPEVVFRGQFIHIKGNAGSCPVGDTVTLISHAFVATHRFAGVPALYTKVRAGGRFGLRTQIPHHRHPGLYYITARCGGGNLGVAGHVRIAR
jgi:hypothetical protein